MRPLVRTLAVAAAGFVAAAIYREMTAGPTPRRKRLPLERWENEGGALPDSESGIEPGGFSPDDRRPPTY